MRPFKRILVPVDFSPHSEEAIRYAVDVAQKYGATLTLTHVYQPIAYSVPDGLVFYTPAQLGELLSELERQLEQMRVQAEKAGALRVESKMLQGVPSDEVAALAKDGGYDLIVMGTHGRTGLRHALMGSVAERVLRSAPCPVLTVHPPKKD